jgi:DNA-binding transcriptional MerR regulator
MKVGEVAARAGVNIETLRYYERRGLLPAPDREPSGHRRYDEETVRFVRAIKEAQGLGFTLTEIADVLEAMRRSGIPSEALRMRVAAKIDEIDGRIAGLRRMRKERARLLQPADAAARHGRRECGQHAAAEHAGKSRSLVAGRTARGPGACRPASA